MISDEEIARFAKGIKQIGDLATKLADNDPLMTQLLLDNTAFMHRRLYNQSDAPATMEELEEEYRRQAKQ